jgi:hypothetical protein
MRTAKPLWRSMLGPTSVVIGVILAACSYDPIEPAPVFMMSGMKPAAEARPPATPTSRAATVSTLSGHGSPVLTQPPQEAARIRPARTSMAADSKHMRRHGHTRRADARHVAAGRKKHDSPYVHADSARSAAGRTVEIPLDDTGPSSGETSSMSTVGARPSWVSPTPMAQTPEPAVRPSTP